MVSSCGRDGINIGFWNLPPELIVGMGHWDIHASHNIRTLKTYFDYGYVRFNYPEELVRRTAAQINNTAGEQKDITHEYSEVTSRRRISGVARGNHKYKDRRLMPDCLAVYGAKKTNAVIIDMAKNFKKDGKPATIIEIDTDAYGD